MTTKLEELVPGIRVNGLDPSGPVQIVSATMAGDAACTVVYRSPSGDLRESIVYRDAEASLDVEAPSAQFSFTADGRSRCGSCWPTTPARARRSCRACSSAS
jgi:hypothetical protein